MRRLVDHGREINDHRIGEAALACTDAAASTRPLPPGQLQGASRARIVRPRAARKAGRGAGPPSPSPRGVHSVSAVGVSRVSRGVPPGRSGGGVPGVPPPIGRDTSRDTYPGHLRAGSLPGHRQPPMAPSPATVSVQRRS
jgi:hypothetical protein